MDNFSLPWCHLLGMHWEIQCSPIKSYLSRNSISSTGCFRKGSGSTGSNHNQSCNKKTSVIFFSGRFLLAKIIVWRLKAKAAKQSHHRSQALPRLTLKHNKHRAMKSNVGQTWKVFVFKKQLENVGIETFDKNTSIHLTHHKGFHYDTCFLTNHLWINFKWYNGIESAQHLSTQKHLPQASLFNGWSTYPTHNVPPPQK